MKRFLLVPAAIAAILAAACNVDPYELPRDAGYVPTPDARPYPDAEVPADAPPPPDAAIDATDACVASAEICDEVDNDCDGDKDEGFNKQVDPNNCGTCGNVCDDFVNAFGVCVAGVCEMSDCYPNHVDINEDSVDGCECFITNGAVEACDTADNDCDGLTDEGFDLTSDEANCGVCGNQCLLPGAIAECLAGTCQVQTCLPGKHDLDGLPITGCEYTCVTSNGGVEACDALDNDCDGAFDEGNPGGGVPCGSDVGACVQGTQNCVAGLLVCEGATGPSMEICNEIDDDCDGTLDEPINKDLDPQHCGGCSPCLIANATPACVGGACQIGSCLPGYLDLDGNLATGCEYFCIDTGVELCDLADNDCDGVIDEGFDTSTDELNCGACGVNCAFANATALCVAGSCQLDACSANFHNIDGNDANGCEYGCVASGAEACNNIDDDCDGAVDDAVPGTGDPCGSDVGECVAGSMQCVGGVVTCQGSVGPKTELCNDLDDNCSGVADEPFDKMNDPNRCGGCSPCSIPGAVPNCTAGVCGIAVCLPGRVDLDGSVANGCEYACLQTSTIELCDGQDNDCDGLIDEGIDTQTDPLNCGACGTTCSYTNASSLCVAGGCQLGACDPNFHDADGNPANGCEYGCVFLGAELCNNLDDDCDGTPDDSPAGVGATCGIDTGACQAGSQQCVAGLLTCVGSISPASETCNDVDDDCDGLVDDPIDKQTDPFHCGGCAPCVTPNATAACAAGVCQIASCDFGRVDLDGVVGTGCEYACVFTSATESCDAIDNDCDGSIDEGIDTATDPTNCGACGTVCSFPNATPLCAASACQLGPCNPGYVNVDGLPGNGCEYACTPAGAESCNGADDDCDGVVDDGVPGVGAACGTDTGECVAGTVQCAGGVLSCQGSVGPTPDVCNEKDDDCDGSTDEPIDKQVDPNHCGSCSPCNLAFATPSCVAGSCQVGACDVGHVDLDGLPGNGCEYACTQTSGTESCDGVDNDCDGTIDEGIDTQTDPFNCGVCGTVCSYANASGVCTTGSCGMGACLPNFHNLDGLPGNGCEYACTVTGSETCNGADDDCDGVADDSAAGTGVACGTDTGECTAGTVTCAGGTLSCTGAVGPSAELCDNLDNDCDGTADQPFDKLNDPRYCGGCTACNLPHAVEGCSAGGCTVVACDAGWVNADGLASTGCEYSCTVTGSEICDGVDNDCDTLVDTADPGLLVPANFCATLGACAGTTPSCSAGACGDTQVKWRCVYPASVETSCGDVVLDEVVCNNIDGDCDGLADDSYGLKGTACDDGDLGECQGTGTLVCNGTQDGLTCNITDPGATPVAEVCNGLDEDCDGVLDNGAPDDMVHVVSGPLDFWIYRYEASRPDATVASGGSLVHRSCSKGSVIPWRSVTWTDANAACAAAGQRLCTEAEWEAACAGNPATLFPYGNSYDNDACNGNDYDPGCAGADDDICLPTGTSYGCPTPPMTSLCVSDYGAYDMSGNLKEWTGTQVSVTPPAYRIRGGGYDSVAAGLTCDFDFVAAEPAYLFSNLGFRCCSP